MKKAYLFLLVAIGAGLTACLPKEHLVSCTSMEGTYVCFNGEGRDAVYARWNFDSVETFNAFNLQGSYPPVPGTTGPWTTVNVTFVSSTGNYALETGLYTYEPWLENEGERQFTFLVRRFEGDAKNPTIKNFIYKPGGNAGLSITNIDGSGKISGLFSAQVVNEDDANETSEVRFFFTDVEPQ